MTLTTPYETWSTWPSFDQEQIKAATRVLSSGKVNYWTGEEGRLFEQEFAQFIGSKYAIAVANGTVALELALIAAGIQPGDEVIVPSRTFIATASSAKVCGAVPVCADVDPRSHNLTAESIAAQITPRTKAIIVVHFAGWPCDMDSIIELASSRNLVLIEDCAQAHGAQYKGRSVGSFGDLSAFSFCQDKIMTTAGEGGMVVTNSEELWRRAWSYKDHGKSYQAVYERDHPPGYRWLHESFGTNMRMTEVQSAIGRIALRRLPEWVETRRRNATILIEALKDIDSVIVPQPQEDIYHSFYKFYLSLVPDRIHSDWNRDHVMESIASQGVFCRVCSCSEIYLEKAFKSLNRPRERFHNARYLTEESFGLLVDPTLSEEMMFDAAKVVAGTLRQASKSRALEKSA